MTDVFELYAFCHIAAWHRYCATRVRSKTARMAHMTRAAYFDSIAW